MYFATQLFSLTVISGKNWLLDLTKTVLNQEIRVISFRKPP